MLTLSILPEEIRIPLDTIDVERDGKVVAEPGYPGVTAIAQPLDNEQLAVWMDAFPTEAARNAAAVSLVRGQLKGLEGLAMRASKDAPAVAYAHATHYRSLPTRMIGAIYRKLIARASLTEVQEKNSDSPSASDGISGSGA